MGEYEVETIRKARMKGDRKGNPMQWEYYVKTRQAKGTQKPPTPHPPEDEAQPGDSRLSLADADRPPEDVEHSEDTVHPPGDVVLEDSNAVEQAEAATFVLEAKPITFANRVASAFSQSTIFGPLASGFGFSSSTAQPASHTRYPFSVNLDPSVSLFVTLQDVQAPQSFLDDLGTTRGPTGKFYSHNHATVLAHTLKPEGAYAKIVLSESAPAEDAQHFERFAARLMAGEMFVQMMGGALLAMLSSDNNELGDILAVPSAQLLGAHNAILMVHTKVEDYTEYAKAAENADDSRW
ncbi:uncharacterized protein BXZ73DRAFT_95620 [Epithele typhae]|uniref:uncharacterized protein n=1 Tax=Epithele typhae TaxID=378194 RepID=UPI0020076CC5|nr:uncharacterized protein BXZ73DRAFT_95620 [Epithele typhae]KAH9946118.1 hypothetical protein BXZ73DRAFT_95620 [Epithele typhae]